MTIRFVRLESATVSVRRVLRFTPLLAVLLAAMLLPGCTSGKQQAAVTLENQSTAELEVEVVLPSRGVFGRKPAHDAFRAIVGAGEVWESTPDTLRFAAEPNEVRGFKVSVVDRTGAARRAFSPFIISDSRKWMHVIFRGGTEAGLTWQSVKSGGAALTEQANLVPLE